MKVVPDSEDECEILDINEFFTNSSEAENEDAK